MSGGRIVWDETTNKATMLWAKEVTDKLRNELGNVVSNGYTIIVWWLVGSIFVYYFKNPLFWGLYVLSGIAIMIFVKANWFGFDNGGL